MPDSTPRQRPIRMVYPLPDKNWLRPLQESLVARGMPTRRHPTGLGLLMGRLISRRKLLRNFTLGDEAILHCTSWAATSSLFPFGCIKESVFICMDCWESEWDLWEKVLRRMRVRAAAFTSRDSAQEMGRRVPGLACHWLPEAIEHTNYQAGPPLRERTTDLLEMGRLHTAFHDAVTDVFAAAGKRHVYPRPGQHYMFKDHAEIRAAMADSRLMVCYPRCDTHPEIAGRVETLTLRYLEGFVSGCLVVGRAPQELIDVFGYDPVIPLDVTKPREQLAAEALSLLDRLDEFQPLVDKNREHAVRLADWDQRAKDVLDWLDSLGYIKTDTH